MEANFFRFLCVELSQALTNRRIDKVFAPAQGIWVLKIQNTGEPLHLLFRPAKSAGHLFLSPVKPANPETAPAMAMWFRKRLRNRRILAVHADWPSLCIAFELTPRTDPDGKTYLLMDCRTGMSLADELPPDFGSQPDWPALEDVLTDPDIWQQYPHISPPLRQALQSMDEAEAHERYFSVATGSADRFYLSRSGDTWSPPRCWPSGAGEEEVFASALDAAVAYGERTLFPMLEMEEDKPQALLVKRTRKKIQRNLAKIEQEEARLNALRAERLKGEALQAELYRIKDLGGMESVEVTHPEHGPMTVALNPFLTPTENMEHYFKLAAKAQRGFPHLARRRQELLAQLEQAEDGTLEVHPAVAQNHEPLPDGPTALPKRYRGLAVSLFRSSDGFTILRGKNKQANHDMLGKAASPFDYWLHAEGGPSSHVILKRDHPGQEVPETTLTEAAILCGLKSFKKDDGKVDILYALVKDVRKVKGFNIGQVAVDRRLGTLRVTLDPAVETRLS